VFFNTFFHNKQSPLLAMVLAVVLAVAVAVVFALVLAVVLAVEGNWLSHPSR
jgi:hypothetical protein